MRPVEKGATPKEHGKDVIFTDYKQAKRYLITRLGEYCSYCETKIPANLAVEHVLPKSIRPALKLTWDNFLLACTNCNSTKGDTNINLADYIWPDRENSFMAFLYDNSGIVKVNPASDQTTRDRSKATIALMGLDKHAPNTGTTAYQKASDLRFQHRIEAWRKAAIHLKDYRNAPDNFKPQLALYIVEVVQGYGFWSVWMTVFSNQPKVQKLLIEGFPGTRKTYFSKIS